MGTEWIQDNYRLGEQILPGAASAGAQATYTWIPSASGAMTSAWAPIFGARRQFDSAERKLPCPRKPAPDAGTDVVCQAVEPRPCKRASSKGWEGGGLRGWEEDKDSLGRRRKGRCHIPLAA